MNKTVAAVVITIVTLGAIGGIIVANSNDEDKSQSISHQESEESTLGQTPTSNTDTSTNQSPTNTNTQLSATNTVEIRDFEYSPEKLRVKKGTTVTWTNQDSDEHTVTASGAIGPNSELFSKGQSYSYTFDTVGTFEYFCKPHPFMKGTVEVVE